MPLPDGGTTSPWPPTGDAAAYARYLEWDAWYSGDTDKLARVYGNARGQRPSEQVRTSLLQRLRPSFWSRQATAPSARGRLHLPLASDIATTSADLLFAEPPTITVPGDGNSAAQDRLDALVGEGLHNALLEAAEVAAALSGVFPRVTWDREVVPDRPLLTFIHPDAAVPEFRWGHLVAVTFWREVARNGQQVLRHLERHEPGMILHGLYQGTAQHLGTRVPLTEHPDTAGLADSLTDGDLIDTGTKLLTAGYVPNIRPSRRDRRSQLGRSDFEGVEGLMDALDETWTSWMRDIRLGRARILVDPSLLTVGGRGEGAGFDVDREIFTPIRADIEDPAKMITPSQFAIRVTEHADTAQALVQRIVAAAGYSAQTFGLTGEVAVTATEVNAREQRSLLTRGKKARYWQPALADILEALLAVDKAQAFPGAVDPVRPLVGFADAVTPDAEAEGRTLQLLEQARSVSIETKVRMLHPEWDDKQVAAEVGRIRDEQGMTVPDPIITA